MLLLKNTGNNILPSSYISIKRSLLTRSCRFTIFTLGQIFLLPFAFGAKKLAAELMRQSVWIPLTFGIVTLLAIITIIWFMPIDRLSDVELAPQREASEHGEESQSWH